MTCKVNHLGVRVDNMDKMLDFYQKAFGFEVARIISDGRPKPSKVTTSFQNSLPSGRVVMMRAGNCYVEVMENLKRDTNEDHARGYSQLAIHVDNIDEAFERVKALGARFDQSEPVDLGYVKVLTGFDPEGNQLELVEDSYDWECSLARALP